MGSISPGVRNCVKRVCIIGAGPSGIAAAKYLLAEKAFSKITILEQRSTVGGLWNYVPCPAGVRNALSVPQTSPNVGHNKASFRSPGAGGECGDSSAFLSPVYDLLETNIPRGLMGFSDLDWPDDCQLFPKHETVLDYIERYAEDIRHLIQFDTQVNDVSRSLDDRWIVKTRPTSPASDRGADELIFDAVLVANGHFDVPHIPSVAGIEEWNRRYPGSISHSKHYRRPQDFSKAKVIVVGNSASGVDIAAQISTVCQLPLIQSQKSESFLQPDPSPNKMEKPHIVEFIPDGRKVRFADGSIESDVDAILYCTGYFYSYPFLNSLDPPVVTSGEYVENLYQHIFYRPIPTLAFATLNQKVIPFPVAEAQSAVIARSWSGRLELPSEAEMERWERTTLEESGGGRNVHVLKFPKDADYINVLHDWSMSADHQGNESLEHCKRRMPGNGIDGEQRPRQSEHSSTIGKEPPYWGEKEYWTRERFPAIKKAFQSLGEHRHSKRTLEDVGFDFAAWKRDEMEEAKHRVDGEGLI